MDKENLFETESTETTEAIAEAVEEVAEEVEAVAEAEELEEEVEAVAEAEELAEECDGEADESMEEQIVYDEEAFVEEPKKGISKGAAAAIIAVVVIAVIAAGVFIFSKTYNKYNHLGFLDISGTTAGQICEESGYDYAQFLADYELPADMPENTNMNAAYSMLPLKVQAAMYYTDFATLKDGFKIPDTIPKPAISIWDKIKAIFVKETVEVTEDTPWGFALNSVTLENVYGENFEEAKTHYEFGEDVTPETLYGDVREQIEKKDMKDRIEAEKLAAEQEGENAPAEGEAKGEAPAEGEAAPAEGEQATEGEAAPAEGTTAE